MYPAPARMECVPTFLLTGSIISHLFVTSLSHVALSVEIAMNITVRDIPDLAATRSVSFFF